ncbi:MAG: prepilin-type N-terminal cleavage/methylation domain-containing protein, partial [Deltaproteobacteria bacterium]|nr:prepilin-type N-terminal cleavage/methylation domain-containing protein [Deltaproteobacteria bacterium]
MALCKCTKKAIAVKSRGFSLIELMIVVAITAALALVAIPNIVTALPKYSVKRAASDMSARIRKARTTAVKERRRIVFDFNVALNRYQIDGQWFPEAGGSLDDHYGGGVSFGFGDASINA